ncbi:MAG: argininosuccinate lyase, partial [Phototrophicales bacterium]
ASIDVDHRLWAQDIAGSKAHCDMLVAQGILSAEDGQAITQGLDLIASEIEDGRFEFKVELEDIHMNIEARLRELIGDVAGKLHTARSRNDQVATDFRLWVRDACQDACDKIVALQDTIEELTEKYDGYIMPGFTHLQVAQPVTLAMHLDAYWQMLERDRTRFVDCHNRLNQSPLGACALSGTGFDTDREMTAMALGFDGAMDNTIDAVSARDFAVEFLFCSAQCGLNLSRLAEEIILWATPQFGFMTLSDD